MALTRIEDVELLANIVLQMLRQHRYHESNISGDWVQTVAQLQAQMDAGMMVWVGYVKDQAVSVVKSQCVDGVWKLWHLAVLPSYQSQGLAKEVLLAQEQLASEQGCIAIECTVNIPMSGRRGWYHHLGYEVISTQTLIKASGFQMQEMALRKSLVPPNDTPHHSAKMQS